MRMLGRLIIGGMSALAVGYMAGITQSSFRYYFRKYSDEMDNVMVAPPQEVIVVESKKRGGKK